MKNLATTVLSIAMAGVGKRLIVSESFKKNVALTKNAGICYNCIYCGYQEWSCIWNKKFIADRFSCKRFCGGGENYR